MLNEAFVKLTNIRKPYREARSRVFGGHHPLQAQPADELVRIK